MPTITNNPNEIIERVKTLRKKAISYRMIDLTKQGDYDGAILVGYDKDSESFVFNHANGDLNLAPFAFVQRANTPTLDPNAPAKFTDGVLAGTDPGLDAAVAVTTKLVQWIGQKFYFGESAEKTMSVYSNAKGVWKLITGTDLVITKVESATPAPKSRKNKKDQCAILNRPLAPLC